VCGLCWWGLRCGDSFCSRFAVGTVALARRLVGICLYTVPVYVGKGEGSGGGRDEAAFNRWDGMTTKIMEICVLSRALEGRLEYDVLLMGKTSMEQINTKYTGTTTTPSPSMIIVVGKPSGVTEGHGTQAHNGNPRTVQYTVLSMSIDSSADT
jgi:hypothetical protein